MPVKVSPESQEVPASQDLPPTVEPSRVEQVETASTSPPSSLEPSAARLLAVLTKIESSGMTVAAYIARLRAQRDALSVEIAEVESFACLSEKFVPRTPSGRKRRVDAGKPRKRRSNAAATTATPDAADPAVLSK